LHEKPQPVVFLSATLWWATCPRLAMALLNSGCRVSAICPSGHPLRTVARVEKIYLYRAWDPAGSLRASLRAAQPDLIIPCDDGAAWQLHDLYEKDAALRPLIELSLGASEAYRTLESRYKTLETASKLGIKVAPSRAITSCEDFRDPRLEWPAVLKIDGTWGGDGAVHLHNPVQAAQVFATLFGVVKAAWAWKYYLVNRHPLEMWLWRRIKGLPVTLQKFIQGRQVTTMFACWQGEVLASVTAEVLASRSATGAATFLQLRRHEEIENASRLLAGRFKLNGFHGLDFIVEDGTGDAYMIEMNPRATQLGHLNVLPEGSLVDVLAAKLMNTAASPAAGTTRIDNTIIALFPYAWKTDPGNRLLITGYHDVPWDQPELVNELMRKPWPERRLLIRILSGLRWLWHRGEKPVNPSSEEDHATLAS